MASGRRMVSPLGLGGPPSPLSGHSQDEHTGSVDNHWAVEKGRPAPGGRARVADRSGSGGVEPVPVSEESFQQVTMAWQGTCKPALRTVSPRMGRYHRMLPDPVKFRRAAIFNLN